MAKPFQISNAFMAACAISYFDLSFAPHAQDDLFGGATAAAEGDHRSAPTSRAFSKLQSRS